MRLIFRSNRGFITDSHYILLSPTELLSLNTTSGVFRKLGRLYGSCLRQTLNDSSIRMRLDKLGGYLQIGSVGPQSISPLISKIKNIGPMPIIGIYYDLSYGRKPQTLLIIDGPTTSSHILAVID